jgi:hypothetical protein
VHGTDISNYHNRNPTEYNFILNEAMASHSQHMSLVVEDYKPIFAGLGSLVDVGSGIGTMVMCVLMSTRKRTSRLQYSVCKCDVEFTGKWSNVGVLFN